MRQRDENRSVTTSEPSQGHQVEPELRPPRSRARGISVEQLLRRLDPRSLRSSGPRRTPRPSSAPNSRSAGDHRSRNAVASTTSTAARATAVPTARPPPTQVNTLMQHQYLLRRSELHYCVRPLGVTTPRSVYASSQTQRMVEGLVPASKKCRRNRGVIPPEPPYSAETEESCPAEGVVGRGVASVPSAQGPVCVICLETLRSDAGSGTCRQRRRPLPLVALACGHTFHAGCLGQWLETSPTCPLCKGTVLEAADLHGGTRAGGTSRSLGSPESLEVRGIAPPVV